MNVHEFSEESHAFYLQAVSPVHIGGASENHLNKDLDYIISGGSVFLLDQSKTIEKIGVANYTSAAVDKTLGSYLEKLNPSSLSYFQQSITGYGDDLRMHVPDLLSEGGMLLPGSSLKGAIRSVLATFVGSKDFDRLGSFEHSFMRFFQVSDVRFEHFRIYNTKIFNLTQQNGQWRGNWKHNLHGNNTREFQPYGFSTMYQCIPPLSTGKLRINFRKGFLDGDMGKKVQEKIKELKTLEFNRNFFSILFEHSNWHLEKELDFFKSSKTEGFEHRDKVIQSLKKLKDLNDPKAPLIRVGSGSGFHNITGDWQHSSHDIDRINLRRGKSRGQLDGEDSAKSRRFAFDHNQEGEIEFFPMGFIRIMTPAYYQEYVLPEMKLVDAAQAEEKARQEAALAKQQAEQAMREAEAKKPQFYQGPPLNPKKRYDLEAIVVRPGIPNVINVHGREGKITKNIKLDKYASPLEVNEVIIVEVSVDKKENVIQASFKKPKSI